MRLVFLLIGLGLAFEQIAEAISWVGDAVIPADNGTQAGPTCTFANPPVAGMVTDDVVAVFTLYRNANITFSVATTGGQTWTGQTDLSGQSLSSNVFWARFNGTWTAAPAFQNSGGGTLALTCYLVVFRGINTTTALDATPISATFGSPSSPFDVANAGITVTGDAETIYFWGSSDDNTWAIQSGGALLQNYAQIRNLQGNDTSISIGWKEKFTAGASGTETNRQATLGGDGGHTWAVALRGPTTTTTTTTTTSTTTTTTTTTTTSTVVTTTTLPAGIIFLSGFDIVDQSTTTPMPTWEFDARQTTTGLLSLTGLSDPRTHRDDNGGTSSSRWSGKITATSAQSAYWMLALSYWNSFDRAAAINWHIVSPPAAGTSRVIMGSVENEVPDPPDVGCAVILNPDRTLSLIYAGGTGAACPPACGTDELCVAGTCRKWWGTTTKKLQENACSTDQFSPCTSGTVAADCPGTSPTCPSTKYYYGALSLREIAQSESIAICELRWDGKPVFVGTAKTIPGQPLKPPTMDIAFGATNVAGLTGALTAYVDDVAIADSVDAGFGYVATKIPAGRGNLLAWSERTCSAGGTTPHVRCINDYSVNTFTYFNDASNNTIERANSGRLEQFAILTPNDLVLPSGAKIPTIETVAVGADTSGVGTRQYALGAMLCPPAACSAGACANTGAVGRPCTFDYECCIEQLSDQETLVNNAAGSTAIRVRKRVLSTAVPITTTDTSWKSYVNQIGAEVLTGPNHNANTRIGALTTYVRVERTVPATPTLLDHNLGAEDNQVTVCAIGDSTLVGTVETGCIGGANDGQLCTQATYCAGGAWAANEKDKPTGGCNKADPNICHTCTGGRLYFPAGLGLACTADADCNLNTCSVADGACQKPDGTLLPIPCTSDPTCNLGTCDVTATCVESCPPDDQGNTGSCPNQMTGWAGTLASRITANTVLACGLGGESYGQLYDNRFQKILNGAEDNCSAKSGTGICQCNTNADCGTTSPSCNTTTHLCTTGDTGRLNCTENTDCAGTHPGGLLCQFPPCDYAVIIEGYNDNGGTASFDRFQLYQGPGPLTDAECRSIRSAASYTNGSTVSPCPNWGSGGAGTYTVATQACTTNGQCTSSPVQQCAVGVCLDKAGTQICLNSAAPYLCTCSVHTVLCGGVSGFCGLGPGMLGACFGLTNELGIQQATCGCGNDSTCPAGYKCVGDATGRVCRRACTDTTSSSDCRPASGIACVSVDASQRAGGDPAPVTVCQARCTTPCDAISCTVDTDCGPPPSGITSYTPLWSRIGAVKRLPGICNKVRGRCTACGRVVCSEATELIAPCSCTTNAECDSLPGNGVCDTTLKRCTAGLTNCTRDDQCTPQRQCLRATAQAVSWRKGFYGRPLEIVRAMLSDLNVKKSQGDAKIPVLIVTSLPLPNGAIQGDGVVTDKACQDPWHWDRDFFASIGRDFLASEIPKRHVLDFSTTFDAERMYSPYHSDAVHYSPIGGNRVGELVAFGLNKLNACVKADGTVQPYCQDPNGVFSTTPCATIGDCAPGQDCARRPCGGNDANCPTVPGAFCNLD